jgi:RNA polymerase sigma-70 factor, ECF subfamily
LHQYDMTTITADASSGDSLVRAAASGDEAAFTQIVAMHHDDMVRVAFLVSGGDVTVAREAAQAAWAIAWRKLGTLREPDRLRPWLMSVAANEARQSRRRTQRRSMFEIAVDQGIDAVPDAAGDPSSRVSAIDLASAVRRLSVDDRTVIALRYVSDLSSNEIADVIGISPVGARTRLSRAIARLRKELGDV